MNVKINTFYAGKVQQDVDKKKTFFLNQLK